jgi:hypothetical protein
MMRVGTLVHAAASLFSATLLATGCVGTVGEVGTEPPFRAVAKPEAVASGLTTSARSAALRELAVAGVPEALRPQENDFYIAVNKRSLEQRWFLTAFVKQFYPGGPLSSAAGGGAGGVSLGTRVVSFRAQNGKLFVFDVAAGRKRSAAYDPEVLVESYPIVTGYRPFESQRDAANYILFDPTAGLNRFGVVGDLFARGRMPDHFQVEVSYAQRFRGTADGATFDQVFTGYRDTPDMAAAQSGERNMFRVGGTLGIALRRYAESDGFRVINGPPGPNPYLVTGPFAIPDTGKATGHVLHWNLTPGQPPIEWVISPSIATVAADPRWKGYDLVGAVTRGIEGWNDALGWKALSARVGKPDEQPEDDNNYITLDVAPTGGLAFAQPRWNPNTGEIRGGSVYVPSGFLVLSNKYFSDESVRGPRAAQESRKKAQAAGFSWTGMLPEATCYMSADDAFDPALALTAPAPASGDPGTDKRQKVERFLTRLILHEVGHALGLRHNFKGSLVPPSSSVMDYSIPRDAIQLYTPGRFDVAALKWLYGLSTEKPTDPFCTDDQVQSDPLCMPYDSSDDPLVKYHGPLLAQLLPLVLDGTREPHVLGLPIMSLLAFISNTEVRPAIRLQAFSLLVTPLHVDRPVDGDARQRLEAVETQVWNVLFTNPHATPPRDDIPLQTALGAELRACVLNAAGKTFELRRACVDLLHKMQTQPGMNALLSARSMLAATRGGITGDDGARTDDLITRIDRATAPYYEH